MNLALLLVKIAADNWRHEGSIFGKNEIVQMMVKRDLMLLGITDGVMCGITIFCLGLQKLVYYGWINWDRSGWIIQNVSQRFPNRDSCLILTGNRRSGRHFISQRSLAGRDTGSGRGLIPS